MSVRCSTNSLGTFTVSVSAGDSRKVACTHNSFLTSAKASEKVGRDLRYHAACRIALTLRVIRWWANRVTIENNPNNAGVVLRIASSDHCLCVSMPRCRRASWKVVSICQRKTNHLTICCGPAPRSVHSKAWVANSPLGSRTNTQRMGTAGNPVLYQTRLPWQKPLPRCALRSHTSPPRWRVPKRWKDLRPRPKGWAGVCLSDVVFLSARLCGAEQDRRVLRPDASE